MSRSRALLGDIPCGREKNSRALIEAGEPADWPMGAKRLHFESTCGHPCCCSTSKRNGWGDLSGYLRRTEVPDGVPINLAPPASPPKQTPQAVAGAILE